MWRATRLRCLSDIIQGSLTQQCTVDNGVWSFWELEQHLSGADGPGFVDDADNKGERGKRRSISFVSSTSRL